MNGLRRVAVRIERLLLGLALGAAIGCAASRQSDLKSPPLPVQSVTNTPVAAEQPADLIVPGKRLTISVAQDASLTKEYVLGPTGSIEFPPLGEIQVEGLRADGLAKMIRERLEPKYLPRADVTVTVVSVGREKRLGTVWVRDCASQGTRGISLQPFPWQPAMTLAEVVKGFNLAGAGESSLVHVARLDESGKQFKMLVQCRLPIEQTNQCWQTVLEPNDVVDFCEQWDLKPAE